MSVNILQEDGLKKIAGNGITDVDSELSETSENPVQNKIVTKSVENLNKRIDDLNKTKFSLPSMYYGEREYRIFGKEVKAGSLGGGRNGFSFVASGVGGITEVPGIYFISCTTRDSIQMKVTEIIKGKEVAFGYFQSGDYVYFGIKTPSFNFQLNLYKLGIYGSDSEIGNLHTYNQAPEGWTEVAITKFATN